LDNNYYHSDHFFFSSSICDCNPGGPTASVEAFATYGTVALLRLQWLGV